MAHNVICLYCKERFDRDKEPYSLIKGRRYAHARCVPNTIETEIIDPKSQIICPICNKKIDTNDNKGVLPNGKIAHQDCVELDSKRIRTEEEKLDDYIMKLFKLEYVTPSIKKQIKNFIETYNFTYSGIRKSLIYFYEIKGNPIIKKATIGIVPYIYREADNYYYTIWLAKQYNNTKKNNNTQSKVEIIKIKPPQREPLKRKKFSFLDEDMVLEEDNGQ